MIVWLLLCVWGVRTHIHASCLVPVRLHSVPSVLVLNFKRFTSGKKAKYPIVFGEHLNLWPYLSKEAQAVVNFEAPNAHLVEAGLFAVVVHEGGTVHGGHYYAFVRARVPQLNGSRPWFCVNDTVVKEVDFKKVRSSTRIRMLTSHTNY